MCSYTMYRAIQNFVDRLTESTDKDCLRRSMADIATALNLSCFAYLSLPRKCGNPPKLISTYPPTWTAHYLGRHYERSDAVVSQAIRDTRPFRWGLGLEPRARSEFERELFEEAAKFGIRQSTIAKAQSPPSALRPTSGELISSGR